MMHEERLSADFSHLHENSPIWTMMNLLEKSGRQNFAQGGVWEKCLCALIMTLKPSASVRQILEALPYEDTFLDEADALNTMAHLGYFARPAMCQLKDIDHRLLPCLFMTGKGEPFIILGENAQGHLKFYDPASLLITEHPPQSGGSSKVWFFQPYDENRATISKFMRAGSGHTWFRALLGRFKETFVQVMAAGLMLNMIALSTPLFIMVVYDRVVSAGAVSIMPMLILGASMAICFEWILRRIRSQGLSWLAGRLDNIVGNEIFAHLIGLSPALIERASVASQIARIKTFEAVRDFFSGPVFLSLLELPFVLVSVAAIAFIAGPLVFVPVSMAVLYALLFWVVRSKVKVAIRLAAKASSARQQFTIETFEKLDSVRTHGLSQKWQEKFRHLSGREMMAHFRLNYLGMIAETGAQALTIFSAVITVAVGAHLIWAGAMTTGALVASMILVWRILTPFYSLCTIVPRLEQLRNSILQVNELIDLDTEKEEALSASRLPKLKGRISFDHAGFGYGDGGAPVFKDLNIDIPAGSFVAVTGHNGTGKSSLLKLVKGLYPLTEGSVRIDGFDIRQLDAPDLRRQMAYISQTPDFFHGTIAENLRFANPLSGRDEMEKALQLADAWDDIQALPDKLETMITSHGHTNLTSSLAAKLSLARAYLQQSNILLIDELPGSILSQKAAVNLNAYLDRIQGKRTVIMATYTKDFMARAQLVIMLRGMEPPLAGRPEDIPAALEQTKGEVA